MKRKSRGRSKYFYDPSLGSISHKDCEEIFTANRFKILEEEEESTLERTLTKEDIIISQEDDYVVHHRSFNLEPRDSINFSECDSLNKFISNSHLNDNNYYMYKKNKNFCSGYFPDFITLDDPMHYQISNNNKHSSYYLKIQKGKYLKYLSNKYSKYNNAYFNEMTDAHTIGRMYSNISLISDKNKCCIQTPQAIARFKQNLKKERLLHRLNTNKKLIPNIDNNNINNNEGGCSDSNNDEVISVKKKSYILKMNNQLKPITNNNNDEGGNNSSNDGIFGSLNTGPVNTGPKENGKLNSSQNNDIINH